MTHYRDLGHATPAEIRYLEQLSYNALPALHTLLVDGWVVRLAKGYTRRANSVNPIFTSEHDDILRQIKACEVIYTRQNQDSIFKLTRAVQPPQLETILDEQGYQPATDHTLVQTANLANSTPIAQRENILVQIDTTLTPPWFEAYCQLNNLPHIHYPTMRQILEQIMVSHGFIRLEIAGEIVAVALGVCEREYMGIFDFVVVESQRRQGLGSKMLQHLMQWGKNEGASTAYLQVVGDNTTAQALYAKYGFATVYAYWYRRKSIKKR